MEQDKPKGKRVGGRKKGTPNKDKKQLLDMILATGCKHPVEGMAEIAKQLHDANELEEASKVYKELAQYIAPKRKAIEHTGADGEAIKLDNEFRVTFVGDEDITD